MGALAALNPYLWKYRGRLFLGFVFVFLTNAFAVFAPVVIGEGVNALQEAYTRFLLPLSEDTPASEVFRDATLSLPPTLSRLAEWLSFDPSGVSAPTSREEVIRAVGLIAGLQALLYLLAYLLKGIFSFMTRQTIIVMSRLIEYDLKAAIYDHYQCLPCLLYTSPSPRDLAQSRMPSSA